MKEDLAFLKRDEICRSAKRKNHRGIRRYLEDFFSLQSKEFACFMDDGVLFGHIPKCALWPISHRSGCTYSHHTMKEDLAFLKRDEICRSVKRKNHRGIRRYLEDFFSLQSKEFACFMDDGVLFHSVMTIVQKSSP